MDKIEDFGVHMDAYYPLKVEIFKTKLDEQLLDLLWNKYWVATLSQSLIVSVSSQNLPTLTTESRVRDIAGERLRIKDQVCCRWHAVWTARLRYQGGRSGGREEWESGGAEGRRYRGRGDDVEQGRPR